MKKLWKRNQIMITALALMIAIAGYLNFMGKKVDEEALFTTSAQFEEAQDLALTDIDSMDSEEELIYSDYLEDAPEDVTESLTAGVTEDMETDVTETVSETAAKEAPEDITAAEEAPEDITAAVTEDYDGETPGEAVFTSTTALTGIEGANLLKEQTRAQNKEALMEIINSENLPDSAKQDAVDSMIALTDIAQKECSAEILLEAKGFSDVVVSITGESADVIVSTAELSQAQRAQIEDIVSRKTGIAPENIIISPVAEN